jgi:hypothetical protein
LEMEFGLAPGRNDSFFSFNLYPQGLPGRHYRAVAGLRPY